MTVFLKRLLFWLLAACLLLPALQAKMHVVPERPLAGAFTTAPHPVFSWAGLLDNTFQRQLEQYLEDHLGFRAFFIRLRNQLRFSVFQTSSNTAVVIGRNGLAFQDAPVLTYLGQDFVGRARARAQVRRLRRVQADLAARGVPLLFVMAPNKARQLSAALPLVVRQPQAGRSNYEVYTDEMRRQGVELLNMTPLFTAWADTARYPLFPWSGTHWSAYGATLAADTLLGRVEHLLRTRLPRLQPTGAPVVTTAANPIDGDLTASLNLLFPPQGPPAVYPQLGPARPRPGEQRPRLLLVGDSFNWGLMFYSPFLQHAFAPESRFWYYNRSVYIPDRYEHRDPVHAEPGQLDLRQQVEGANIIILLFTEHNLPYSEFGFTQQVFDLYHPLTAADRLRIQQLEKEITAQQRWEDAVKPGFAERMHEKALTAFDQER